MSDFKDDMNSTVSGFSMISVGGEENVSADQAIDESLKKIQSGLNELHQGARLLLMSDERDDTWEEMDPTYTQIVAGTKEVISLMKELASICKQMMPPKPRSAKKNTAEPSMIESCSAC